MKTTPIPGGDPTTPSSGDEPALSDERILSLAAETELARDYNNDGDVQSTRREDADITDEVIAFARAVIAADRAARQAPAASRQQAQDGELDAARYRWLRDRSESPHNFYISVPVEFHAERYQPHEVDAYIDAAIAASKGAK